MESALAPTNLAHVLERVAKEQRSGWLDIEALDGSVRIGFSAGTAIALTGAGQDVLRLEPALGVLSAGALQAWSAALRDGSDLMSALEKLVETGWIPRELGRALAALALEEVLLSMLGRVGLLVRFHEARPGPGPLGLQIDALQAVAEADRRHRERGLLERRLPGPDRIVWPGTGPAKWADKTAGRSSGPAVLQVALVVPQSWNAPEGPLDLSLLERWLLARAVSRPTFGALIDGAPFGRHVAMRAAARLLAAQLLQAQPVEEDEARPARSSSRLGAGGMGRQGAMLLLGVAALGLGGWMWMSGPPAGGWDGAWAALRGSAAGQPPAPGWQDRREAQAEAMNRMGSSALAPRELCEQGFAPCTEWFDAQGRSLSDISSGASVWGRRVLPAGQAPPGFQ